MNRLLLLTLLFTIGLSNANAQYRDSVVFDAMLDELERNMKDLKEEDKGAPFFISYSCDLSQTTAISASLGSIYYSTSYPYGTTGVRVMVGDYDFNHESLYANNNDFSYDPYSQVQVPIKEDYWGLRKIFWKATDRTYRSAAESFEDHKKLLEKEGLAIDTIPHRSFAKTEIVKHETIGDFLNVEQKDWEQNLVKYSALFNEFDDLESSGCSFNTISTKHFFVNSEGTKIKTIKNLIELSVYATMLAENGEQMYQTNEYLADSWTDMPDIQTIQKDINILRLNLKERQNAVNYDNKYEGPVLLEGLAVASFLNTSLSSSLRVNTSVKNPSDEYGYTYKSTSIDDEIGEVYTNELVSISIQPSLKIYDGMPILGGYEYDNESVKPVSELLQIDHGVLKNLQCSRTVSKESHIPNGTINGPGVILSHVEKTIAFDKMKKKLIKSAKSKKLDYAIIIRNQPSSGLSGSRQVFKVDLKTGEEILLDGAVINGLDRTGIEQLVLASEEKAAYNLSNNYSGDIVSCIAPKAVLVNEVRLSAETMSFKAEPSLVQNTLIK